MEENALEISSYKRSK